MIAFRAMMAAASAGAGGRIFTFNFIDATYTPPIANLFLIDFDPYGRPSFNFKVAGNTPPVGNAVNFNFTS
jgi:hypothetical protein